jgi:hypothetical protein
MRACRMFSFDRKVLAAETTEERLLWSISSRLIFDFG